MARELGYSEKQKYQYLLGKVSTIVINYTPTEEEEYQYLLGKVSTAGCGKW